MEFLYVFALMFLSIFGLAVLVRLFTKALIDGSSRKFEIYVHSDENIEELLKNLDNNPNIGQVYVIVNEYRGDISELEDKFENVKVLEDKEYKWNKKTN